MSLTYGVTPAGFVGKPADVVDTELDNGLKTILGASAGTASDGTIPLDTFAGQLKTLLADAVSSQWDLQQGVYSSFDPNANGGAAQDAVGSITGTKRQPAAFSTVTAACTGTPLTILPAGRVAIVQKTGSRFDSLTTETITLVNSWAATTGYALTDRVTNVSKVYQCITAGTSAGAGGPTGTSTDITDGSVHWKYLGDGTGAVDVVFECEVAGQIAALAGDLNTIGTPVGGWNNVVNLLDAVQGHTLESDFVFRVRRDAEVTADAAAIPNAIRAAVLAIVDTLNPIVSCTVFYNDGDVTDGDGLPPHSVNVLVLGGSNTEIANVIFNQIGAGIASYGATSVSVVDSAGNSQTVNFDRPTPVPIYVIANVTYDPLTFPSPDDLSVGEALIADAIALYAENPLNYPVGKSVRASALEAQVFDGPTEEGGSPVPGILDVTDLFIGIAPSPGSSATIVIASHEVATFDTSRITVNLTPGSP